MSEETLAEQVAKIQPGDTVRAVFRTPGTSSGEWEVKWETSNRLVATGGLYIVFPSNLLRYYDGSPASQLLRIEEHRLAARPFYTNRGADRQPRRGDQIEHPEHDSPTRLLVTFFGDIAGWRNYQGRLYSVEPGQHPLAGELFEDQP